jgi:phenylacetate-coenzyme A ligase PaaK-like adenylate-forming protein
MQNDSREFREHLLARSLTYAVDNVPFYRNLTQLREKRSSLELEDFPIVGKEQIAANLWDFVVLDRFPDYIVVSSGTEPGPPSISFRNEEEYQAAHHYFTGQSPAEFPDLNSITEFTLDIFFNTNGYSWRKAPGWPALSVRLERRAHALLIRDLIQKGLVVGGRQLPARMIQCQNGPLRTLTGYFLVTDFSPRDFDITSVYGYGSHISSVWRERLEAVWGGEILTSYGLSEFAVGNARQCAFCGDYHFWTAWPEFVALDMSGPVEKGDAILLLTSLVPFTQVQPRIRYLTRDFVTVTGRCEATDQMGFRFRGRTTSSAITSDGESLEVLLSEIELIEVLDQLPDISCQIHSCEQQLWSETDLPRPPFRLGVPRFKIAPTRLRNGRERVKISIETVFDTGAEKARTRKLADRFTEKLFTQFPRIPKRLNDFAATLDVELLPPDALGIRLKATA